VEGGECWGVAYAVPPEDEARIERGLARREAASERHREVKTVETPQGEVRASVWVSAEGTRDDAATLEARLRAAHGVVGNGTEYVRTVAQALDLHGLHDPLVNALWSRLAD
jgi:cation transport regulator ChaC